MRRDGASFSLVPSFSRMLSLNCILPSLYIHLNTTSSNRSWRCLSSITPTVPVTQGVFFLFCAINHTADDSDLHYVRSLASEHFSYTTFSIYLHLICSFLVFSVDIYNWNIKKKPFPSNNFIKKSNHFGEKKL